MEDWYSFYHNTPVASCFQSPEWADIWMHYTGGRFQPSPLLASLPSGNSLLIPLTKQNIGWGIGSIWHGSPAGTYGGYLNEPGSQPDDEALSITLCDLFGYCGSLVYRHFPFAAGAGAGAVKKLMAFSANNQQTLSGSTQMAPSGRFHKSYEKSIYDRYTAQACDGVELTEDRTHFIRCEEGFDAILKGWSDGQGKIKRKIKKAQRSGVRVRRSVSSRDMAAYYNLYLMNTRRWSPPPSHIYKSAFFEILLGSRSIKNPKFKKNDAIYPFSEMWIAELGKKIVAGAIVLTGRQHMAYWHGVSDTDYYSLRPVNLLISEIIRECCRREISWFDFNPSMGIPGVEQFKKSFGAETADCPVLSRRNQKIKLLSLAGDILQRVKKIRGK